ARWLLRRTTPPYYFTSLLADATCAFGARGHRQVAGRLHRSDATQHRSDAMQHRSDATQHRFVHSHWNRKGAVRAPRPSAALRAGRVIALRRGSEERGLPCGLDDRGPEIAGRVDLLAEARGEGHRDMDEAAVPPSDEHLGVAGHRGMHGVARHVPAIDA